VTFALQLGGDDLGQRRVFVSTKGDHHPRPRYRAGSSLRNKT
jgi:hypothetical protein